MSRYANRSTQGRQRKLTRADREKRAARNERRGRDRGYLWLKSVQVKPKKRRWSLPKRKVKLKGMDEMFGGELPPEVRAAMKKQGIEV